MKTKDVRKIVIGVFIVNGIVAVSVLVGVGYFIKYLLS